MLERPQARGGTVIPYYSDKWVTIYHGDCREILPVLDFKVDLVLTDPPYPKEYIPLYSDLGKLSKLILKDGGGLVTMAGQSYLGDVMVRLSEHLTYNWTLAYLTPGGQSAQLWQRKVNSFWKPVLWYVNGNKYTGKWIGDVSKSNTNDNDKEHHKWGQSVSGFVDLVNRMSVEGQIILDPFCGGGTTCYCAKKLNRYSIGIDIDEGCCEKTADRCRDREIFDTDEGTAIYSDEVDANIYEQATQRRLLGEN